MAKKVVKTTKAGRGSEQFMLRMPPGMRAALAAEAETNGRSMNAEIVARIDFSFQQLLSPEGLIQVTKRMEAGAAALDAMLFDIRDFDLEAFIADQRSKGTMLTRTEAIRLILRTYLSENGFLRIPE
jgi:hypothetical protein